MLCFLHFLSICGTLQVTNLSVGEAIYEKLIIVREYYGCDVSGM